jgi:hypothetical protein
VRRSQDDDAGYLAWVQSHPDGLVVNTERRPSPAYLVLHRADCAHITRATQPGSWTTAAYIKVCAPELAELERWARTEVGGRLQPCHWCAPRPQLSTY